jgi:hypothetical protein
MKNFFPMSRGDILFIVVLLLFSLVSFLPWARDLQWAGMSMLGWLMALLMLLSPVIALTRLSRGAGSETHKKDELGGAP